MSLILWVKALHIMAVIAWMAAMLYLPRLFVYHSESPVGSPQSETFKVMERRLMRAIMTPSMIAVWVLGITLVVLDPSLLSQGWLHAKILLVLALSGLHGLLAATRRAFAEDRNTRSARFYRIVNELPALAMVLIVILVVVKPF
jgi:putative membrane protein